MTNPVANRPDLRQRLIHARASLQTDYREAAERKIGHQLESVLAAHPVRPTVIGIYAPIRHEPILRVTWDPRLCLALPIVTGPGEALQFVHYRPGEATRANSFNVPEPVARQVVQPDLLIIPCLGFQFARDRKIYRLGYGKGYYDRTLARTPVATIGIAFDVCLVEEFLPEPHDVPLDCLITESSLYD